MTDDNELRAWFCREVLPLEGALLSYIRRNLPRGHDASDIRQEVYARVLGGVRSGLPANAGGYLFVAARNHLINLVRHAQVVSVETVADLESLPQAIDLQAAERQLSARDELRRAFAALEQLPPRCREVVQLRKLDGLSTREVAEQMGIGIHTVEKQLTLGMRAIADYLLGGSGKIDRGTLRGVGGQIAPQAQDDSL